MIQAIMIIRKASVARLESEVLQRQTEAHIVKSALSSSI